MTPRVSVVVMAHRKREQFVPDLLAALDRPAEVIWDQKNDRWDTGRRAMLAHAPDATHHLVVQDDAIVCRDLVAGVEKALQYVTNPERAPLCLYVGRVTPYREAVEELVAAAGPGTSWLTMSQLNWGVGIVMPVGLIRRMVKWGDGRPDIANYDKRMSRYLQTLGVTVWYPWPSLVEHRDSPSLVPGRNSRGRHAHQFVGADRSALDLPYDGHQLAVPDLRRLPRGARRPHRTELTSARNGPPWVAQEVTPAVTSPDIMIARRTGTIYIEGRRRMIRKGMTTAHRESPVVTGHPKLWEPLRIDYPALTKAAELDSAAADTAPVPAPATTAEIPPATALAGSDGGPDNAAVREWAAAQSPPVEVAPFGRIPAAVLDAYRAAHGG